MSLKKGDLVEVIGCSDPVFDGFIGNRFTLEVEVILSSGKYSDCKGWMSPFSSEGYLFAPLEKYLRKVNLDGDERSDESFESLMKKLKSFTNNNNIVTVGIKLEEKK